MLIETDVVGLPVLVVGPTGLTEPAARRYRRAGARVIVAESAPEVTPVLAEWARLAVLVGAAREWPHARAALSGSVLLVEEPAPDAARGRVVLVGAGPGGTGLLTLDGLSALADADVVLTDRLAEVGDVAALAPGPR